MVRLADLPPAQAQRLAAFDCPNFTTEPWVTGPPLSRRRVAIVSSAGLLARGGVPFRGRDPDYHTIPPGIRPEDLLISHVSINFDRTGFQEDWNVAFPISRLKELAADATIGSVADTHYSFMGAAEPDLIEPHAREVAVHLKRDSVDAVLLAPV
jgi:D-proline reductase (dithiol) PrdB